MGLFSSLRGGGSSREIDLQTAVMIPSVSAMLADGSIDDDEIVQIRSICLMSPIYASNSRDEDTRIIVRAIKMIESDGAEQMCGKASEVLPTEMKEAALAFAVLLVMSDGHVSSKEERLIDNLVNWLGVEPSRAEMIVQVSAILRAGGN
jgi:tellurite resistance protein